VYDNLDSETLLRLCTAQVVAGDGVSHGTAFFVAPGYMVTCAHVVTGTSDEPLSPIKIVRIDGETDDNAVLELSLGQPYPDLALLRVKWTDHPCVSLDGDVELRDELRCYGYPSDPKFVRLEPITLNVEGFVDWTFKDTTAGFRLLRFTKDQVRAGMSGAPLLNTRTLGVCAILKRTMDTHRALGGYGVRATEVLRAFSVVRAAQDVADRSRPLPNFSISVATIPVRMPIDQTVGENLYHAGLTFWGQRSELQNTYPWFIQAGDITAAAEKEISIYEEMHKLREIVPYWTDDSPTDGGGFGISRAVLTGSITLRNSGKHAHSLRIITAKSRLLDPRLGEYLHAGFPPAIDWLPGPVQVWAEVGPTETEDSAPITVQSGQPYEFQIHAKICVDIHGGEFRSVSGKSYQHKEDIIYFEQVAQIAFLNASLALRRYLLSRYIELAISLTIDGNPVSRVIRVAVELPEQKTPAASYLSQCWDFENFGDFLLRWLKVRKIGFTRWRLDNGGGDAV
jgi:hypothetical protein